MIGVRMVFDPVLTNKVSTKSLDKTIGTNIITIAMHKLCLHQ